MYLHLSMGTLYVNIIRSRTLKYALIEKSVTNSFSIIARRLETLKNMTFELGL